MSYFFDSEIIEFTNNDDDDEGVKSRKQSDKVKIRAKTKAKTKQKGIVNDTNINALVEKHRHLFTTKVTVPEKLPIGWVKHLARAFDAYTATGLELRVSRIEVKDCNFIITVSKAKTEHLKLFKKFLLEPLDVCPLCGARTEKNLAREAGRCSKHWINHVNLCTTCKDHYQFSNI